MVGIVVEVGTAVDAQPRAVIPTKGLERQIEYHLVAKQRLEVYKLALQPAGQVIVWLDARVNVELLDVDLQLIGNRIQAPHALAADLNCGNAADQHSLDHRLEPKVQLNRRPRWYADHCDSEIRGSFDGCPKHLHSARLSAQFV